MPDPMHKTPTTTHTQSQIYNEQPINNTQNTSKLPQHNTTPTITTDQPTPSHHK
jgi:hypothetical protein